MLTGIVEVALAESLLVVPKIKKDETVGFAFGIAAHGIGTSRAYQINSQSGASAAFAMTLARLATGLLFAVALRRNIDGLVTQKAVN